ncbi:conserved hypothetical protein [Vibrio rotiferianus]|nr:conserved hypothetical protein [Vibrio rotiferianus]CAH1594455.1 conserved hypothetical protein [Vibrio rotiferianus]
MSFSHALLTRIPKRAGRGGVLSLTEPRKIKKCMLLFPSHLVKFVSQS